MIPEIDIFRIANLFVRQYGEDAAIQAAMRHDDLLARGDLDGASVWKRVLAAINVLLATDRPTHERLN